MTEIDSYYDTVDSDRALTTTFTGSGNRAYGQTIRPSTAYTLTICKFNIRRGGGTLTGNLKAYLYAHTGTFGSGGLPTGDPLATSDSLDMATLTTSYTLYTFTFNEAYVLVANTAYCLIIYSTDGSMTSSSYPRIGAISTGAHEGNGIRYLSSVGDWQAYSTIDIMFYVYGDVYVAPTDPIKALPSSGLHGWYDTNEEWLKIAVDEDGILETN